MQGFYRTDLYSPVHPN